MLPREFWNRVNGFYKLENMRERQNWERERWSTCILVNMQVTKGKRIKPTDLITFDWEQDKKKVDFEELKNRVEYIKKLEEHGK